MLSVEDQKKKVFLGSARSIMEKRMALHESLKCLEVEIDHLDHLEDEDIAFGEVKHRFFELLGKVTEFKELNQKLDVMGEVMTRTPFLCSYINKFEFTNSELDEEIVEIHHLLNLPHDDFRSNRSIKKYLREHLHKLNVLLKKYETQQNNILVDSWYMDIGECD